MCYHERERQPKWADRSWDELGGRLRGRRLWIHKTSQEKDTERGKGEGGRERTKTLCWRVEAHTGEARRTDKQMMF